MKKFLTGFILLGAICASAFCAEARDTLSWHPTTAKPNPPNTIGQVYIVNGIIYAATTSKYLYYSNNNGETWNATSFVPDYGRIKCVFVNANNTIYVGTSLGNIFTSKTNGFTWKKIKGLPYIGQPINSIFADSGKIYAATTDGNLYYSVNQLTWNKV